MLSIQYLRKDRYFAWDKFVSLHRDSGPYMTTQWKQVVEKSYRHNTFYIYAHEKNEIVGALPLVLICLPFLKRLLISLPYCDYGGVIAENEIVQNRLLEYAIRSSNKVKASLEIRSKHVNSSIGCVSEFQHTTNKCRMILEIPESSELLWNSFKSKLRSQIRNSMKHNLQVRMGRSALVDDFYKVFSKHMRFLGSPVHSRRWITEIVKAFDQNSLICIVYNQSLPIGVALILIHNDTVTVPWASTLYEYKKLSPNMLLYWQLLKFTAENGYKFFDFGRSTPGEGTYAFKEQWGAKPAPLSWYRYTPSGAAEAYADASEGLRSKAERLWRKMPLALANAVGPHVRRYIDR